MEGIPKAVTEYGDRCGMPNASKVGDGKYMVYSQEFGDVGRSEIVYFGNGILTVASQERGIVDIGPGDTTLSWEGQRARSAGGGGHRVTRGGVERI